MSLKQDYCYYFLSTKLLKLLCATSTPYITIIQNKLPVGNCPLAEVDGPTLCMSRIIPLGWAFTVPRRIGLSMVFAAFSISITDIHEKARKQRLKKNKTKIMKDNSSPSEAYNRAYTVCWCL